MVKYLTLMINVFLTIITRFYFLDFSSSVFYNVCLNVPASYFCCMYDINGWSYLPETLFCWWCMNSNSLIVAFMFFLKCWMNICDTNIKYEIFSRGFFLWVEFQVLLMCVIFQIDSVVNLFSCPLNHWNLHNYSA